MPAEFQGTCYATGHMAQDVYFSGIPPYYSNVLGATSLIQFKYIPLNGVWQFQKTTINATTSQQTINVTLPAPIPSFRNCTLPNDPLTNFTDGMTLGWGVATVMIIAALIVRIKWR